jgi:hypothetical protein
LQCGGKQDSSNKVHTGQAFNVALLAWHCLSSVVLLLLLLPHLLGPTDKKPWDHVHGYQTVLGNMRVSGLTLADFGGATACPAAADGGTFAIGNHPVAPDAFHPHFFKQVGEWTPGGQGRWTRCCSRVCQQRAGPGAG